MSSPSCCSDNSVKASGTVNDNIITSVGDGSISSRLSVTKKSICSTERNKKNNNNYTTFDFFYIYILNFNIQH